MAVSHRPEEDLSLLQLRLSAYLDKLSAQVFDLEETIGDTVGDSRPADARTITSLQGLDFLRQSLEDLALMTLLIGQSDTVAFSSTELDQISKKLKLDTTRAVLQSDSSERHDTRSSTADDLDLF